MGLFVIADLHLSLSSNKPMSVFGQQWQDHHKKIKDCWNEKITDNDRVLIPGDISWAMDLKEAMIDLEWINDLSGEKILLRGNHDYWWSSVSKMNELFPTIKFLQNNYYRYKEYAICGTRGWICPNEYKFSEHDQKIYDREVHRLKLSLDAARKDKFEKFIVMTHYPPTNDQKQPSNFTQTYEEYGVEKVVYGHLHGEASYESGLKGIKNGVEYFLTSCDYLGFEPMKLLDEY